MGENQDKGMAIYIIDEEFRIVYLSEKIKQAFQMAKPGQFCYEVFGSEKSQCRRCPLLRQNKGKSLLFDHFHKEWISVKTTVISRPDGGVYQAIVTESLQQNIKNLFLNAVGNSDYSEFLELNYEKDTYQVIYHSGREGKAGELKGSIGIGLRRVAEQSVHPEDQERFCDFWRLDRIGEAGIPEELLLTRHAEFRKRQPDGSYRWMQLVMVPSRQNTSDDIFVMIFYNEVEAPAQWDHQQIAEEMPCSGLYTKSGFFHAAETALQHKDDREVWCILSIDIENFKLFNEWYGWEAGDKLIEGIADVLRKMTDGEDRLAGYFGNDDFAVIMPYDEQQIEIMYRTIVDLPKKFNDETGFLPAFGICEITDGKASATRSYDYAELARSVVRGNYNVRIRKFNGEMLDRMEYQYEMLAKVKKALRNGEFTFYLQPKCNMENGRIIGAEALAGWLNEKKERIAPAVYIPVLEQTGFITALDTYIWDAVCSWQRSILDRGLPSVPVSVNVSRADLFFLDVPACFLELIRKYDLKPELIEIEITESVYSEDDNVIGGMVSKLRKAGFRVLMDDFGSGYSSLNMLKDVEVDVLKMDMRFLDINENNAYKGISIIEAVRNMANLIGIDIIAEGVETLEQKRCLLEMGCRYGQGYYFYHPLPIEEFEKLLEERDNLDQKEFYDRKLERFYLKDLLSEDMFSEIMINNMLGAVAFYDVHDGGVTVKRYNEHYASLPGGLTSQTGRNFLEYLNQADCRKVVGMFARARKDRNHGAECDICWRRPDCADVWLHMGAFFLKEQDGHAIYYASVSDVTDIYIKNEMLSEQNKILEFLNNDMPGGYYCHKNTHDMEFLHISKRFLDIVDFTREEIRIRFQDKFANMIHPDDRAGIYQSLRNLKHAGGNCALPYRIRSRSGYISVYDLGRLMSYDGHEFFQGIILCEMDSYKQLDGAKEPDEVLNTSDLMPCGIFRSAVDGDHEFTYVSNSMLAMLGYSRQDFREKFQNSADNMVYTEDRKRIGVEVSTQLQCNNYVSCEYRIELADGSLKWVYSRGRMTIDAQGKRWFYTCIMDYDYLKEKYREKEWQQMKYRSLAEIPGTLVYDYDPFTDLFTMEIAMEDGRTERIVTEKFVENIEHHPWLSPEGIEKQRTALQAASLQPMSGTMEFKGYFVWDREEHWYRSHFTSLADEDGIVYRIVGRADHIDDEKKMISDLRERSRKDSITNLLNNESARENMGEAIRKFHGGTLFLLDIDDFREINKELGHMQSDELLKKAADIVDSVFQKQDIQSRFGGDVFLIFMPGIFDRAVAVFKAQELLRKVQEVSLAQEKTMHCSIGIAIARSPFCSVDSLLHQADTALCQAKHSGRNQYVFYTGKEP